MVLIITRFVAIATLSNLIKLVLIFSLGLSCLRFTNFIDPFKDLYFSIFNFSSFYYLLFIFFCLLWVYFVFVFLFSLFLNVESSRWVGVLGGSCPCHPPGSPRVAEGHPRWRWGVPWCFPHPLFQPHDKEGPSHYTSTGLDAELLRRKQHTVPKSPGA